MDIQRDKRGGELILILRGRLDASWAGHVADALTAAIRDGEHHLRTEMSAVGYVSSAGLRTLLTAHRQAKSIGGSFGVLAPSLAVREVLELAGLEQLIATPAPAAAPAAPVAARVHEGAAARHELHPVAGARPGGLRVRITGEAGRLLHGATPEALCPTRFGPGTFALGVGALGPDAADSRSRLGELLAAGGAAAYQPTDGPGRPDFVVTEGGLEPSGHLLLGLTGEGDFALLSRFTPLADRRTVSLAGLAGEALALGAAPAVAFVAAVETAGLVGATLRQSPAAGTGADERFAFPAVRDWLSFTPERSFRDSTALLAGVVARAGTPFEPLLRPLGGDGLRAHVHAAVFPYRPVRQGAVELAATVRELFDGQGLQAILHLLADPRGAGGAGDSEFLRGALWSAPAHPA
jgi:anti-anti-sigma factor